MPGRWGTAPGPQGAGSPAAGRGLWTAQASLNTWGQLYEYLGPMGTVWTAQGRRGHLEKREQGQGQTADFWNHLKVLCNACAIRKQAHAKDVQGVRGMVLPRTSQSLCEGSVSSKKSWLSSADPASCPQCPAPSPRGHH